MSLHSPTRPVFCDSSALREPLGMAMFCMALSESSCISFFTCGSLTYSKERVASLMFSLLSSRVRQNWR